MFIRVNKVKGHTYLVVQEGVYINGKTISKSVKSFGRLEPILKIRPNVIEEMKSLIEHDKAKFIREYIDQDPFVNTIKLVEIPKEFIDGKLINYGCKIYKEIWKQLQLQTLCNKLSKNYKIEYSLNDVICYLSTLRILNPCSKLEAYNLTDKYKIGIDYDINTFYRSLDILAEHKEEIELHLYKQTKKRTTAKERKLVLYDVTTFYFESTASDDLKSFGYSKDNKINQVQVVYSLMVLENGLPLCSNLYSCNTSESKTLESVLLNLKERFDIKDLIIIADKGINSKLNLHKIEKLGFNYILSYRLKSAADDLKSLVLNSKIASNSYLELAYKSYGLDEENNKFIISNRLIVGYSYTRANKEKRDRQRLIDKANVILENPSLYSATNKRGGKKFIKLENKKRDIISLDKELIEKDSLFDGYYAICSSDDSLSATELHSAYSNLWLIEESFRLMKTNLKTRPIYHWTPKRIQGHLVISFIALYLQRYLEYKLDKAGHNYTTNEIIYSLNETNYAISKEGIRMIMEINACYQDIVSTIYKALSQEKI